MIPGLGVVLQASRSMLQDHQLGNMRRKAGSCLALCSDCS